MDTLLRETVNAVVNVAPYPLTTFCKTINENAIKLFCKATGIPNLQLFLIILPFNFMFFFFMIFNLLFI